MGTVVTAGEAIAVVFATGPKAEFGRIAVGLAQSAPETAFQAGLRRFSYLLLRVALTLTVVIFVTNMLLGRSLIDSALFGLAIAVGITRSCCPPSSAPAWRPGRAGLPRTRFWSNDWCASRTSATSTS